MSGFRATADPLAPGARVTAVTVEDPLYPYGSSTWGPSPKPGATITPRRSAASSCRVVRSAWNFQRWGAKLAGKYVLVLPYLVVRPVTDYAGFAPTPQ